MIVVVNSLYKGWSRITALCL